MATGELLTRWSVRLALAGYALALALQLGQRTLPGRRRLARGFWTFGCAAYLAHVACAFHFYHSWSHTAAYEFTAQRVAEWFGLSWGGGLYLNYLFTAMWVGDVLWWRRGLEEYERRPRWVGWLVQGFLAFMAFNGAVVFATGPVRWVSLGVALALALLWFRQGALTAIVA